MFQPTEEWWRKMDAAITARGLAYMIESRPLWMMSTEEEAKGIAAYDASFLRACGIQPLEAQND